MKKLSLIGSLASVSPFDSLCRGLGALSYCTFPLSALSPHLPAHRLNDDRTVSGLHVSSQKLAITMTTCPTHCKAENCPLLVLWGSRGNVLSIA